MAAKASEAEAENRETREESGDGPLIDQTEQAVKKMIARAKENGYVTYEDLNATLPSDQMSSEKIEDVMAMLSDMGINVVESEEADDGASANQNTPADTVAPPPASVRCNGDSQLTISKKRAKTSTPWLHATAPKRAMPAMVKAL